MKRRLVLFALGALAACNSSSRSPQAPVATPSTNIVTMPLPAPKQVPVESHQSTPTALLSCAADIGSAAAARRVAICLNVSPATHPPCNAANSCALIDDEIARSCALFDGKGPAMAGCDPAPKSVAAAVAVVQRYYAAINARDYATAWSQWGEDGRPGQPLPAFAAGFAHTRAVHVTTGTPPTGDAGMGSIYQPVPVTVDATLDDGRHQRFQGSYVIRRVNDVDGATAAQLRWHIDSAKLSPVTMN